jgi:hypothetical protein
MTVRAPKSSLPARVMRMSTDKASECILLMWNLSLTSRTVVFVIEEKKHPRFERVDDDLTVTLNITLSQALLGPDGGGEITKEVNQLDGRRIPVTLPAGVSRPILHFDVC